jgi:23S rRNA (cytosine1962-C5)-methyltransferase
MTRLTAVARVSRRGAARWTLAMHPWIYRTDLLEPPADEAGAVEVIDNGGRAIGMGLYSPRSTIALRMLTRKLRAIDAPFWKERIAKAVAFRESTTSGADGTRAPLAPDATAYRLIHAEADGLPSLFADRYGPYIVVQLLSAGLEPFRGEIIDAIRETTRPAGVLARHDTAVRALEGLDQDVALLHGEVPETVEVEESGVRYLAAPWTGQKTGAFLDQRENRVRAGQLARGHALDCFCFHGSFALHLAKAGARVTAVDSSADALARARENAALNGLGAIDFVEANAFDFLRDREAEGVRYDVIVLDPPAFAKRRDAIEAAIRGYKEINLRALKLLAPGGHLLTFSCSWHIGRDRFRAMLEDAAADSGRLLRWVEWRGQATCHPEIVQIPESAYLKGAVLQAVPV